MEKADDCVDAFRNWEKTHNRENYGRYDAFAAGRAYALRERDEEIARLREANGILRPVCDEAAVLCETLLDTLRHDPDISDIEQYSNWIHETRKSAMAALGKGDGG